MTLTIELPRFVRPKPLAQGAIAFYWEVPGYWQKQDCPYTSAPLGKGLGQAQLDAEAKVWNDRFDEWLRESRGEAEVRPAARYGTVKWLVNEYLRSDPFLTNVAKDNRADYHNVLHRMVSLPTRDQERYKTVGDLPIKSINAKAVDMIYAMTVKDGHFRNGEKLVSYSRTAWSGIMRYHEELFIKDPRPNVANPWIGVTLRKRVKREKPAVDRETVYAFAWAAIEQNRPELGAAAVICFEWLQRPMNVVGGHIGWTDYRGASAPTKIRIEHHKTGKTVLHPLEDRDENGKLIRFYEDAEAVLAKLPRRGAMMILGPSEQKYKPTRFAQLVRRVANRAGLPKTFSLDACRHGGMTELEEAELTEGQGMALSAHVTPRAYRGYAKRTEERLMAATRRRMAYREQAETEAKTASAANAA